MRKEGEKRKRWEEKIAQDKQQNFMTFMRVNLAHEHLLKGRRKKKINVCRTKIGAM